MKTGRKRIEHTQKQVSELFYDDLISEVCDIYTQLVIDHELNEQTLNQLITDYYELFEDYEYYGQYTWIALAYTQFELGLLTDKVKENAIKIIDEEIKKTNLFMKTKLSREKLLYFKELLNSNMPNKIVVRKPKYYKCPWKIGDVFAFKLDNSDPYVEYGLQGKYALFVKAAEHICYPKHVCPKILYFNWYGDEPLYDLEQIKKLDYLPTSLTNNYINYKIYLVIEKESEVSEDNLIYIGNIGTLNLPKLVADDLKDHMKIVFKYIRTLKKIIPIELFIQKSYKIKPNNYQIIDTSKIV